MRFIASCALCAALVACANTSKQGDSGDGDHAEAYRVANAQIASFAKAAKIYKMKRPEWLPEGAAAIEALKKMGEGEIYTKDPWGSDYLFKRIDDGGEIRSAGPDKKANTADDIFFSSSTGVTKRGP